MRKHIICLLLFIFHSYVSFGQMVSPTEAGNIAKSFMELQDSVELFIENIKIDKVDDVNCLYTVLFTNGSWCFVSADRRLYPILAYGFAMNIFYDMPEAFYDMTEWYKMQNYCIITGRAHYSQPNQAWEVFLDSTRNGNNHQPIIVLLDNTGRGNLVWGQSGNNGNGDPCTPAYNQECEVSNSNSCMCGHKPVGCGAVALGEVMWYWNWPRQSRNMVYHWENIPPILTPYTEQLEVSELTRFLRNCGDLVNMNYHCSGSWTLMNKITDALCDSLYFMSAMQYNPDGWWGKVWVDLLKSEIDNGRPVIYFGQAWWVSVYSHYFIVDGYDNYDFFHINFGHKDSKTFCRIDKIHEFGYTDYDWHNRAIVGISPTYCESTITNINYSSLHSGHKRKEYAYNTISIPATGNALTTNNGTSLELEAGNEVVLNDGFWAKRGSEVSVKIKTEWLGGMAIIVPDWPTIIGNNGYSINPKNADSWEFTLLDINNNVVFQSAGSIRSNQVCLWNGLDVSSGYYLAMVTLKNSYGRKLHHEHTIILTSRLSSQDSSENDCNGAKKTTDTHDDNTNGTSIKIVPNPSDGIFNVLSLSDTIVGLEVYNTNGHLVYVDNNIMLPSYTLNLGAFPVGNYVVTARCREKTYSAKIIKQ